MAIVSKLLPLALLLPHLAFTTPTPGEVIPHANPHLSHGFSTQQLRQVKDGISDAMTLANAARVQDPVTDSIFKKYFRESDKQLVFGAFDKIVGALSNMSDPDATGNAILGDIVITPDLSYSYCNGTNGALAYIVPLPKYPLLSLCSPGLEQGGIDKAYGNKTDINVTAVTCNSIGSQVSWRMDTLGQTLLHEYTHYQSLVSPPLLGGTQDCAYGPGLVQALDKKAALSNADSFAWFASEVFWSRKCSTEYEDPKLDLNVLVKQIIKLLLEDESLYDATRRDETTSPLDSTGLPSAGLSVRSPSIPLHRTLGFSAADQKYPVPCPSKKDFWCGTLAQYIQKEGGPLGDASAEVLNLCKWT